MHPLRKDPWFAAQLDAALVQHRHALTPRQIEAFSEAIARTFETHPAAQRVLARERPPNESAVRVKEGAESPRAADRKAGGGES